MSKKTILGTMLMAFGLHLNAQTVAADYKGASNNNPISANIFCADPTALEYNGRLYVYGTNDHQQFNKNGKKNKNEYGDIKSVVVFSTDDMVNWTFHGTIDTKKLCFGWVTFPWYQTYGVSWAPSVTWRTTEDGTDEFFLYFCNNVHGIGVLKANSPVGPWKSPNNKLMINYDTPGAFPMGTSSNFDPGVVIDENGTGWIAFGGLNDGGKLLPDNTRIAKLKPSMTELDGQSYVIPAPYHFEANELNVINGKFVFTYCSHWTRSQKDWDTYKAEKGISVSMPAIGSMCYMVSDDPTNPDSWVYKGYYGPQASAYNNHSHLQKFQGAYYHIYHSFDLMKSMKSANGIDSSCDQYRSICVNNVTVNEETQIINKVTLNKTGVSQIKNLNPYDLQQAETMASCGGIAYEDFTNIKKNTKISTLGNDASENMQVKMKAGSWINVRKVDFGTNGAAKFMLRAKGTGTMEIRSSRSSNTIASFEFSSTDMEDHTFDLDATKFQGVKNSIYFVMTAAEGVYVDAWQFIENTPVGVASVRETEDQPSASYDLSGRRLREGSAARGIVIEQYTDGNGNKYSRKRAQ